MKHRAGKIDWLTAWSCGSLAVLASLAWGLRGDSTPALSVACAASMRAPIEQIAAAYQAAHGVDVQVQFGGSQTLLAQLEAGPAADVYLPADDWYAELARQRGVAGAPTEIAAMHAVIIAADGNPLQIRSWRDLLRDDVRVALGNPDQAAIGRAVRGALLVQGNWSVLDEAIRARGVYKPTVSDAANDVALGAADASIVWHVVARQYPELVVVDDEFLRTSVVGRVAASAVSGSRRPADAGQFVEFLASAEVARAAWREFGLQVDGPSADPSAEK